MPIEPDTAACQAVAPSAPSELAWVLNLLVQTARYAEPALAELEQSLLPGIHRLREPVRGRFGRLWSDQAPGCPELVLAAHLSGCLLQADLAPLFDWLGKRGLGSAPPYELLTEEPTVRPAIQERLERLCTDASLRARYLEILTDVWDVASAPWEREGRAVAHGACESWVKRIGSGTRIEDLVAPRHPLTRSDQLGFEDLFLHRSTYAISPLYFCMSGGHVVDVGDFVHVAVPASDLLPVRRVRDAAFVADRLRVLAEPTRVRILLQLLSAPSGVMDVARILRISQPTVSGHMKVLRNAGLVQQRKIGSRNAFVASRKRVERLLEDARGTIARWD